MRALVQSSMADVGDRNKGGARFCWLAKEEGTRATLGNRDRFLGAVCAGCCCWNELGHWFAVEALEAQLFIHWR